MKPFLVRLCRSPGIHAKFLNTLSLLEYIGARKILKSQTQWQVSAELLAHIAEEIRHAQILKRLALVLSPDLTDYADDALLCGSEAVRYFQSLDQAVADRFGMQDPVRNYLVTTFLIEKRAAILYPVYQEALDSMGLPQALSSLIRDEERHLKEVSGLLAQENPATLQALEEREKHLFERWWEFLEKSLAATETHTGV